MLPKTIKIKTNHIVSLISATRFLLLQPLRNSCTTAKITVNIFTFLLHMIISRFFIGRFICSTGAIIFTGIHASIPLIPTNHIFIFSATIPELISTPPTIRHEHTRHPIYVFMCNPPPKDRSGINIKRNKRYSFPYLNHVANNPITVRLIHFSKVT